MPRGKKVPISETTHQRLEVLAARRKRPMGRMVEELVEREVDELSNPWLSSEGLSLKEKALEAVWGDSALDVYDAEGGSPGTTDLHR